MELKIIQNDIGCYNLLRPSEKSLSFSMGIYQAGEVVKVDGVRAVIRFSGDVEEAQHFEDPFDNLAQVFQKCYEDGNKWCSSTDYVAQCHVFAKLYSENYEEINSNLVTKHKEKVQKQIDKLQKELTWDTIVPEITYEVNESIDKEISKYKKWVDMNEKEIAQLKEDSEKAGELKKKNEGHQSKINSLESFKIKEPAS